MRCLMSFFFLLQRLQNQLYTFAYGQPQFVLATYQMLESHVTKSCCFGWHRSILFHEANSIAPDFAYLLSFMQNKTWISKIPCKITDFLSYQEGQQGGWGNHIQISPLFISSVTEGKRDTFFLSFFVPLSYILNLSILYIILPK